MDKLIELLLLRPSEALKLLRSQQKDPSVIANYISEYEDMDRNKRNTQVGRVQENKTVGQKVIDAVRLSINYQEKIVNTSVAFEVGEPITLIPKFEGETNVLANLIKLLWKTNRLDNVIQKILTAKKSQTQSAVLFYVNDIKEGSYIQKVLSFFGISSQKKEIKLSILDNKNGTMSPYFDAYGDMIAFVWDFNTIIDSKDVKNTWVYTADSVYKSINDGPVVKELHGFDKIPIVYVSQDKPEFYKVQPLIDRQEVTLSKFCDSNDRTAYPLLKTYGDVQTLPGKDDNGKVLNFPMEWSEDAQKFVHGDADFLTYANAPEAVKLEFETMENLISYGSSTPILTLNNLKFGNVTEKTVKLMFLDPIIKAKKNEGDNRTMIERIINVMISGIVNTTNTNLKNDGQKLYFDIQFNSILPGDLTEAATTASTLKAAGLASTKTLVEYLAMNENVQNELDMIEKDKATNPADSV